MPENSFSEMFDENKTIVALTLTNVVELMRADKQRGRLLLSPIQRSVVWTNKQIIHYWDSLLRNYPSGLMMVHPASEKGRDANGNTVPTEKDDFQLFDGQQRMTAILLGFGMGQLKETHKLWVDLGVRPNKNSDLKFQLRINSIGQPFGYRSDEPNQKIELKKKRDAFEKWESYESNNKGFPPFKRIEGENLVDTKCAVSLKYIIKFLDVYGKSKTICELKTKNNANCELIDEFVSSLDRALNSKLIFHNVSTFILNDHEEYIRFYTRLGQGGTRLSDDELTYSIIKYNYPEIHDRMIEIMEGDSGRLAGEVDLVLSALRVSKILTLSEHTNQWEVISRPNPSFVSQLKQQKQVESKFLEFVPQKKEKSLLKESLDCIRKWLNYNDTHREGLPSVLLAQLPKELIDVLVLLACDKDSFKSLNGKNECLRTFVLYWLFFIHFDAKAARLFFQHFLDEISSTGYSNLGNIFTHAFFRDVIEKFEDEKTAYIVRKISKINQLEAKVTEQKCVLSPIEERFRDVDNETQLNPLDALIELSTNQKQIKRVLMWLQREYLSTEFPDFDPTSNRDEDLPFDLDHLVPLDTFGFNWNGHENKLKMDVIDDSNFADLFWEHRKTIGNSLGNYRWLSSSENRGRGNRNIEPLKNKGDLIDNIDNWNALIEAQKIGKWSKEHIKTFQNLIDLRSLALYKKLLIDTKIEAFLFRT